MLKKALLSLFLTVFTLLTLNGLTALGERLAYGAFWVDGRPDGLYHHQSGERPQLRPGAELNGWLYQISINSLGFRGPPPTAPASNNRIRIWCIGGSTTFDIYAPTDALTWPAQLQGKLQAAHPDKTIEVINAGIPGEIYSGSLTDIQRFAQDIKPDWVVMYHGPNDLREVLSLNHQAVGAAPPSILEKGDFALFRLLKRNLQQKRIVPASWSDHHFSRNHRDELERRIHNFLRGIQPLKIRPILVTHAFRAGPDDTGTLAQQNVGEAVLLFQQSPENSIESLDGYNQLVKDTAERFRIPLADVRSAVPSDPRLWGDATHFKAPGSELAAHKIAETLSPILSK